MWKKTLLGIAAVIVATLCGVYFAFSQPDIPRRVLEAKYAGAPSQFVLFSDGARVHYRDRGPRDAPVLLLLHGSNSSLFDWEPWSKILSDRFRVIALDLPGHGLTGAVPNGDYSERGMTVFVKAFADKLGLGRFAIGGNSMGGGVAARFAEMYPQRVTHLVIVDGFAEGISVPDRLPLAYRLAHVPVLNHLLLYLTPRWVVEEGLNKTVMRKAILTPDMIDRYWDFVRMAGTRQATLTRLRLPPDSFVRDHVGAIKAPTLILWGEEDRLIPVASAHAWAKAVRGSKLIVYPGTGHLPMEEDARESANDVRAFLGGSAR